jgi:uncharacterized membrane protein
MNMDNNPFKAPDARVADAGAASGEFVLEGQRVPAGNGVVWLSQGWEMFKLAPGVWIGITVIFMASMFILGLIPIINLVVGLLGPVLVGGLMLGCKALDDGQDLQIGHLFSGFSGHAGNLILVGLIYLAGAVAIGIVVVLLGGGLGFGAAMMSGGGASPAAFILPMLMMVLVGIALMMPLAMAMWYAPALVVLHDVAPFEAMKSSFFACIKNFVPFLVYGLVILVLAILATIPLALGWLVLMPVMYASIYASYKDMFIRA